MSWSGLPENIEVRINIEPGHGRLVYDKARRTIVAQQVPDDTHPGGWPRRHSRLREAWWIITGQRSLHRAWQRGYDQHAQDESLRRARGGK